MKNPLVLLLVICVLWAGNVIAFLLNTDSGVGYVCAGVAVGLAWTGVTLAKEILDEAHRG